MNEIKMFYTLVLLASLICAVILIAYSCRRRMMPGANYFILVLATAILYNGAYIFEINSTDFATAKMWFDIEHIAIPMQHFVWAMMSLDYTRMRKGKFLLLKYLLLYHPILYYIVYYSNLHSLYISNYQFEYNGYFWVILTTKGIMYYVITVSGTLLGIIATASYLRGYMRAPHLQSHGYLIMMVASLFPWFTVYLSATSSNYLGIDYYPVATIFSGFLYMFGIFRFQIFSTMPIATEIIFRQSKEAIMLLDSNNRIIDANDTIISIFPNLDKLSKKTTLTTLVSNHPELNSILEDKDNFEFSYLIHGEKKHYSTEVSRIITEDKLLIGKIVTISDITLFYENEKKLEYIASNAMNKAETNEISFLQAQISPHFINNTLSVIASMITRAPNEAKVLITDLGDYLANCYYFDSESAMVLLQTEIETVETYVNIEKARFRERLDFQIICDYIPDIYVPRLILQPLVENAIRHGILKKIEGGTVCLIIECKTDRICFEIKDNGVGMSEETKAGLTMNDTSKKSIGIMNIHKRLLKFYEEGLTIKSEIGQGTSVSFFIIL